MFFLIHIANLVVIDFWFDEFPQVVASQDWPEVTKYAGLVFSKAHCQEIIQYLYKSWQDSMRGTLTGGMIKYTSFHLSLKVENLC